MQRRALVTIGCFIFTYARKLTDSQPNRMHEAKNTQKWRKTNNSHVRKKRCRWRVRTVTTSRRGLKIEVGVEGCGYIRLAKIVTRSVWPRSWIDDSSLSIVASSDQSVGAACNMADRLLHITTVASFRGVGGSADPQGLWSVKVLHYL